MTSFELVTIRLGKSSVSDIKLINALQSGTVNTSIRIDVTSTQVANECREGIYAFIWLGSDNNKGQSTEWKQGFKAIGKVIEMNRGLQWNDESITSIELLYVFPEAISRLDFLAKAPQEYYGCSAAPIIGLDDHSNQTVRYFDSTAERCSYSSFFYAIERIVTGFRSAITRIIPEFEEAFHLHVFDTTKQIIYYGAPGTGKSYKIDNEVLKGISEESKIRVTFYPDYYYSDFIGGLRPKKTGSDISYEFTPGPFTEALEKSFKEPTYLIIEEINRGNPAAIFGDIFQLLDRREDGRSRYEITNEELLKHLSKDSAIKAELVEGKIFLPKNLNILCTMNTADQNVFVLDTAFKRRFRMEYVPIDMDVFDSDTKLSPYKGETYPVFVGSSDVKDVMGETGKGITSPKRDWPTFAKFVNAKIDEMNSDEIKISEDKKLGPFFVGIDELKDRKKFADKVLYYLKQDVFKYENVLRSSYETLYYDFTKEGSTTDIFGIFNAD